MKTSIAFLFLLLNAGHLFASGEPEQGDLSAEELLALLEDVDADVAAINTSSSDLKAIKLEVNGLDMALYTKNKVREAISDLKNGKLKRSARVRHSKQMKILVAEIEAADTSTKQLETISRVFKKNTTGLLSLDNISTPIKLLSMPIESSSKVITIGGALKSLDMHGRVFKIRNEPIFINNDLLSFRASDIRYQTLIWDASEAPKPEDLIGVVDLTFGHYFNLPIDPGVLPPSLTNLTYVVSDLNLASFRASGLPCHTLYWNASEAPKLEDLIGVVHLTFGNYFNLLIDPGVLPPSLTNFTYVVSDLNLASFRSSRASGLPCHTLYWSASEAPKLEDLIGVVDLTFGYFFDGPIEAGVLPPSLTLLTFGRWFNHPIAGALPDTLTQLTLSSSYGHEVEVPAGCSIVRE